MKVRSIDLTHFRNYDRLSITVGPDINVFYGANAQGKTNILEAVYLCACARSHRTSRDADLILQGESDYGVALQYESEAGPVETLEIRYLEAMASEPQRSRALRVISQNDIRLDKVSDLMGLFHAVIFAPEDLMLIKEGPSSRRRFLDLLISQIRPTYFQDLQRYGRLLLQRNKMLKDLREQQVCGRDRGQADTHKTSLLDQLDVWDLQLAQCAARIVAQRLIYAERLAKWAEHCHQLISSGKEKLDVKYRTVGHISQYKSVSDLSERLYQKYKTNVSEDIIRGSTSVGPHRDDLEFLLNGEPMKPFASQGQQRSAVLSLKLAELEIVTEDIGERPVLLLDDVMSELDIDRRRCLLTSIDQAQVFITCTDAQQVVQDIHLAESQEGHSIRRQFNFFEVSEGSLQTINHLGFLV
jgi:DNA replication and repair protein RecF